MDHKLNKLLDQFVDARGFSRLIYLGQIRQYTSMQRVDILEQEIKVITSQQKLNALLGAGMRGILYDIVNARRLSLLGTIASQPREIIRTNGSDYPTQ